MGFLIICGIAAIFVIATSAASKGQQKRLRPKRPKRPKPNKPALKGQLLPRNLGLQSSIPLQDLVDRLETAFAQEFGDRLKQRVLKKHPTLTPEEYNWQLLELKRYLLMAAILRDVPMFSEDIDEIWHEMLLFSRQYDAFCKSFARHLIHHSPHTDPTPNPGGRAWFDWVYCQLFEVTPYSVYIWKGFFRQPLDRKQLLDFQTYDEAELLDTYFNRSLVDPDAEVRNTVRQLIHTLREQMTNSTRPTFTGAMTHPALLTGMTMGFVFFSLYEADAYHKEMNRLLYGPQYMNLGVDSGSIITCGGFVCTSPSNDSGNNACSSSSCSTSSCSSSSCSSSSCGGGSSCSS